MVELGPQTNTRPLSNEGEKNNKRNADNNLRNILYAQSQLLKQRNKQKQKVQQTSNLKIPHYYNCILRFLTRMGVNGSNRGRIK